MKARSARGVPVGGSSNRRVSSTRPPPDRRSRSFGVGSGHIANRSKSATCWSCRAHGGESHGNWRGGKTKHKAGYIMVRRPEHPRAARSNGYVFEHTLVMEERLGRHLLPEESVHLELWVRPQPSGIRMEDALEWARVILSRYGELETPPTTLRGSAERSWR